MSKDELLEQAQAHRAEAIRIRELMIQAMAQLTMAELNKAYIKELRMAVELERKAEKL